MDPIPFNQLEKYLAEADIVVSPRIRGNNTPMKIFPFLASGKPVLATDIYTHNQLLTHGEAYLASPSAPAFAEGIIALLEDDCLRERIGKKGMEFIENNFTYNAHKIRVHEVYNRIEDGEVIENENIKSKYA